MPVTVDGGVTTQNQPLLSRLPRQLPDYYVRAVRKQTAVNARYREALVSVLELASIKKKRELRENLDRIGDDAGYQSNAYRVALRQWENRESLGQASAAEALRGYQADIRTKIAGALGIASLARGALNPVVSATLNRTGYNVDKLVYESLPGWFVSANFYYPTSGTPAPAVILMPGHATEAKHYYQDYAQGLAKLGYCCLAIDNVGSGERLQVPSTSTVLEHALVGKQFPLVGWTIAGVMAWDASRGVDYMLTRSEVNPNHIGATGTSGGGTQTVLLTAFDSRLTMVATSCFVNTFQRNLENDLWADHEQVPPLVLGPGYGFDIDDFLIVHAPKPLVIIAQLLDYFDLRGVETIFDRVKRIYDLVGATDDDCQIFIDTNDHQLDKDGREAGYRLFNYAVGGGHGVVEPAIVLENPVSVLWATATGDVNVLPGAVKSTTLLANLVTEAEAQQGNPTGDVLRARVRDMLKIPPDSERGTPPEFRIWEQYVNWTNNGTGLAPKYAEKLESSGVDGVLAAGVNAAIALNNIVGDRLSVREKTAGGTAADHFSVVRVSDTLVKVQAHNSDGSLQAGNTSTVTVYNFGQPSATYATPNYPTTHCCVYAVEVEDDLLVPTYYLRNGSWHSPPPTVAAGTRAILYIPHLSADIELSQPGREPLITSTIAAEPTTAFFAADIRGTGESRPIINGASGALTPSSPDDDFFAEIAEALGQPLLGRLVWDILRVVDMIASYGYTSVYLIGRGHGSVPAALAALLDTRITQVRVKNSLTRWRAVARAEPDEVAWSMSRLPYNVLPSFDLTHVYAELANKPLGFVNDTPWGAWGGLGGET